MKNFLLKNKVPLGMVGIIVLLSIILLIPEGSTKNVENEADLFVADYVDANKFSRDKEEILVYIGEYYEFLDRLENVGTNGIEYIDFYQNEFNNLKLEYKDMSPEEERVVDEIMEAFNLDKSLYFKNFELIKAARESTKDLDNFVKNHKGDILDGEEYSRLLNIQQRDASLLMSNTEKIAESEEEREQALSDILSKYKSYISQ